MLFYDMGKYPEHALAFLKQTYTSLRGILMSLKELQVVVSRS